MYALALFIVSCLFVVEEIFPACRIIEQSRIFNSDSASEGPITATNSQLFT